MNPFHHPLHRLVCAVLLAGCCLSAAALEVGSSAPAFELTGPNGPVSLAQYRGQYLYLDFWASWCAPCKRSFPWMGQLQQRNPALKVLAISVDSEKKDAEQFLQATPIGFAVAFDPSGQSAKAYAIKGMPTSVLIDPDGKVLYIHSGFNNDAPARIEQAIAAALSKSATPHP
jgi:thiol-disulfide isomerase/thioredoxin